MMPRTPTLRSAPETHYLSQLLEEIHLGDLRFPRFKRYLVWDVDQCLELLRSVRDGVPIGAIMVWRTHLSDIATYDRLGSFHLPSKPVAVGGVQQYVLDGVQRLITLYGALYATDTRMLDEISWMEGGLIYYDLVSSDFVVLPKEEARVHHLPTRFLFDSIGLLGFLRGLKAVDDVSLEQMHEEAMALGRAFRECRVPVIPVVTDNLESVARVFQRVHVAGTPLNEMDMLNALTWTPRFDLQTRLADLRESVLSEVGWAEVDDSILLKCCKSTLGFDIIDEPSVGELSAELRKHPDLIEKAVRHFAAAASFLAKHCAVFGPACLPYGLQGVLLADVFRCNELLDDEQKKLLRVWFWMTTYGEMFAGQWASRLRKVADVLKEGLKQRVLHRPMHFGRRPLPVRFDIRSARGKAFALRLAEERPRDSKGVPFPAADLLAHQGVTLLIHIFTREELPQEENQLYASPANRLLAMPGDASAVRELLRKGDPSPEWRESHLIFPEAYEALRKGRPDEFLRVRMKDLDAHEERFLQTLLKQADSEQP